MNLLFEDMIRVETNYHICRIWRQCHVPQVMSNTNLITKVKSLLLDNYSLDEMVIVIAEIDMVNSVEIIHRDTGCGVCVHKDWP